MASRAARTRPEPVAVGASYGTPGSGTDLPAAGPAISDGGTGTLPQVG